MNTEQLTQLRAMADAADMRCGSPGHARRVHAYARPLVETLGLYGPEAEQILAAAYLHDIGKVLIAPSILQKPGPLSAAEWLIMKKHPLQGADMLITHTALAGAALVVRAHHERPDGLGYPYGLDGPLLPLGACIVAVADSFDAMTTTRPYSAGISASAAAERLSAGAGSQWDRAVVLAFLYRVLPHLKPLAAEDETRPSTLPFRHFSSRPAVI